MPRSGLRTLGDKARLLQAPRHADDKLHGNDAQQKGADHPENLGKSKSEIKPSEMAMMRAVAKMPRTGCLRPDKGRSFRDRG